MSKSSLSIAIMIAITDGWVDSQKDRPLLEKFPLLAGMLTILSTLYKDLLRVAVITSEIEERARGLTEKATELNGEFDDAFRAFRSVMSSLSLVSGAEKSAFFEKIKNALLPDALVSSRLSYLEKSGIAESASARMTPEWQTALEEVSLNGKTLYQLFEDWVSAGQQLGDIVRKRSQLLDTDTDTQVTPGDVQRVKRRWVRTVKVFEDMLELESDVTDGVRRRLLQPLHDAEEHCSRKKNNDGNKEGNGNGDEDTPADGDTPGDTPPSGDETPSGDAPSSEQ